MKTYPDRGGHTDPHELAVARAQAGIYLHAIQLVVADLGREEEVEISERGFLVLSRPGSNQPSIRPDEDLPYQRRPPGAGLCAAPDLRTAGDLGRSSQ